MYTDFIMFISDEAKIFLHNGRQDDPSIFCVLLTTKVFDNKCVGAVEKTHNFEENLGEDRAKRLSHASDLNVIKVIKAS